MLLQLIADVLLAIFSLTCIILLPAVLCMHPLAALADWMDRDVARRAQRWRDNETKKREALGYEAAYVPPPTPVPAPMPKESPFKWNDFDYDRKHPLR